MFLMFDSSATIGTNFSPFIKTDECYNPNNDDDDDL